MAGREERDRPDRVNTGRRVSPMLLPGEGLPMTSADIQWLRSSLERRRDELYALGERMSTVDANEIARITIDLERL